MDFLIVIENTAAGYSAYAPDIPGCIATGHTLDEVRAYMREAVEFHMEGLRLEVFCAPEPTSKAFFSCVDT